MDKSANEIDLVNAIRDYGEEPSWKKIIKAILNARGSGALARTKSFANLVESVKYQPKRANKNNKSLSSRKIHPATQTFQGIRIAINNELESIKCGLQQGFDLLEPSGVLVAISFHSLEDRIVKRYFRNLSGRPEHNKDNSVIGERIIKASMVSTKAVKASKDEISFNPRSRSARMRGIKKLPLNISS